MIFGLMLASTHRRILSEQIIADTEQQNALREQYEASLKAFKSQMVEQAASENKALKEKNLELRNEVASLSGKLIHYLQNPESPVLATSGLKKP